VACRSESFAGSASQTAWHNWIGLAGGPVTSFFEPASLGDIVGIVQDADAAGRRVHVAGSGWAYEDVAYSPDVMVSLARLNKVLDYVTDPTAGALVSSGRTLVHVEGGMKVATLNAQLAARGLAMPTLGGSNGQSIVGALSTSTHGGDFDQPPFCDLVHAVHLVGAGGQEYWVERATAPVTSSARLGRVLPCPDTLVVRDDEALDAIVVGLGRFGVIYSVILEVVPAYSLAKERVMRALGDMLERLRQGIDDGTFLAPLLDELPPPSPALGAVGRPRAMQLLIDPRNPSLAHVVRNWLATGPDPAPAYSSNPLCDLGAAGVIAIAGALLLPTGMSPTAVRNPLVLLDPTRPARLTAKQIEWVALDKTAMTPGEALAMVTNTYWDFDIVGIPDLLSLVGYQFNLQAQRGPSYAVMTGAPTYDASGMLLPHELHTCYRANSCEIVFDATDRRYLDLVDDLARTAPSFQQSGYISVRFSARSRALLSMHNVGSDHAVSIEVSTFQGMRGSVAWIDYALQRAQTLGGRPHWGQQNHTTTAQIEGLYGSRLDRWRAVLGGFTGDSTLFSNGFTTARGLEPRGRYDIQIEGVASELASAADAAVLMLLLD
jgi:hypothetical protein